MRTSSNDTNKPMLRKWSEGSGVRFANLSQQAISFKKHLSNGWGLRIAESKAWHQSVPARGGRTIPLLHSGLVKEIFSFHALEPGSSPTCGDIFGTGSLEVAPAAMPDVIFGMDRRIILIHTGAINGGAVTGSLNSSKWWCRKKPLALVNW